MKRVFLGSILIGCALLLSACNGDDVDAVKPHEPGPSDLYCVYEVTASRGGGAIPVGGTICIYCPPPVKNTCKQNRTISPAPGIEYDITTDTRVCLSCPAEGKTYELK